jgi:hypothetical protein
MVNKWKTPQEYGRMMAPQALEMWREHGDQEERPANDIYDLLDWLKMSYRADNPPEAYNALVEETVALFEKSKKGKKADMIHSDSELATKMEPAAQAPEAGPSNTELVENSHSENGASPMLDGDLHSPERANVNAMREAVETQAEMEVGKPIGEKQEEVEAGETMEIDTKPGKQIIINIAGAKNDIHCKRCGAPRVAHSKLEMFCPSKKVGQFEFGKIFKASDAEGIGGEDQGKITSGHGGGMFGGTDLVGKESAPQFATWDYPAKKAAYLKTAAGTPDGEAKYVLWALPKGSNDRMDERPMTNMLLTLEQVEKVKQAASKDGWHGFRVQKEDFSVPDFTKGIRSHKSVIIATLKQSAREFIKRVRTAAINVSQGEDAQGFHMIIDLNGRQYVLRGADADAFRREYAAIPKPEAQVNALVEKYMSKLQPRTAAINVAQGEDAQGFHMVINLNGREYLLRGADADSFRREYAGIAKPPAKVNALVEKYMGKLQPYAAKAQPQTAPAQPAAQAVPAKAPPAPVAQPAKAPKEDMTSWLNRKQREDPMRSETENIPEWLSRKQREDRSRNQQPQYASAKKAGLWTMKCPWCGGEASKGQPDGSYKCAQCAWSQRKAAHRKKAEGEDYWGFDNWITGHTNLLIENESSSSNSRRRLAESALRKGIGIDQLAGQFSRLFKKQYDKSVGYYNDNASSARDDRGAYERHQLDGTSPESSGDPKKDKIKGVVDDLWYSIGGQSSWEEPMGECDWRAIAWNAAEEMEEELKAEGKPTQQPSAPTQPKPDSGELNLTDEDKKMMQDMGVKASKKADMKNAGEGKVKNETELEKEAGFNFFFPGQVLKEFYPEIQHEIVDYPNASNTPMGLHAPEMVGDGGHDIEGMLDGALDNVSIVEAIQLPGDVGELEETHTHVSADYSSTSPAGAMGIGRDGKSQVLEGAPLRKENDIRGPMFTDEFYGQYQAGPKLGAIAFLNQKTAGESDVEQFSMFLKKVCGEIAATMVYAFKATSRPLLDKVPGVGEIQLSQVEQPQGLSSYNLVNAGSRVKYLMDKLNDGDVQDCINDSWAQAAVWHDGPKGGFVYEVFIRMESIDTDSMIAKYRFVCGTRE